MQTDYDAIIVGAGPAGATAAILLARAGWSIALIEKHRFPRRKVCGECLAASNLALLDELGVGAAFAQLAGPALQRVALLFGAESVSAALPAAPGAHPFGRALGREHLDSLLLARARELGACVLQPFTAQGLHGGAGAFSCELLGPSGERHTLRAPVAIAAQGSWEPLPHDRPQRIVRGSGTLLAFKANYREVRLPAGLLPVLSFAGGYGGMVIAEQGRMTLACCIRAARLQACRRQWPGLSAGAAVEAYLRSQCAGVERALEGARRTEPWLAVGPLRPGIHLPRSTEEPFRIGNAAAEAHPIVGEGISMALQSAWLLCEQLLRYSDARLADARSQRQQRNVHCQYALQWRRHFGRRTRLAACLAHAAMRPALMSRLWPLVRYAPGILTRSALWSGKTRCAGRRVS